MKLKVDEILKRHSEKPESTPSQLWGFDSPKEWKDVSVELVEKVKSLGGDADWWFAPPQYIQYLPPEPKGTSIKEIVEGVGFNHDFVMLAANGRIRRDFLVAFNVATKEIIGRELRELPKGELPPLTKEEMRQLVAEFYQAVGVEKVQDAILSVARTLRGLTDQAVWVCRLLKKHGIETVDKKTYFAMNLIYIRVWQAQNLAMKINLQNLMGGTT